MEINKIADDFLKYMKSLPEKEYYKLFYGSFIVKSQMVEKYVRTLKLDYSSYVELRRQFDDLGDYTTMMLTPPKKKVKPIRRKNDDDDESE